jgi:hypothetical protein
VCAYAQVLDYAGVRLLTVRATRMPVASARPEFQTHSLQHVSLAACLGIGRRNWRRQGTHPASHCEIASWAEPGPRLGTCAFKLYEVRVPIRMSGHSNRARPTCLAAGGVWRDGSSSSIVGGNGCAGPACESGQLFVSALCFT